MIDTAITTQNPNQSQSNPLITCNYIVAVCEPYPGVAAPIVCKIVTLPPL
jgi:hypothetical protein